MVKNYGDLIWTSEGVGSYDFNCWLGKDLKEKVMPHYTSVCLNRFKEFYAQNYSSGREIYIYKWKMGKLVERWSRPSLKAQIGKVNEVTLRPILVRWYILCRKYGMLPKSFIIPKKTDRFYIKNTSGLPPSLFYVYITHLRQVWEEANFVYNFMTLVDKYKLNPWSSYVCASAMSISNCNHHVLNVSRSSPSVKIGMMFDMKEYFAAPRKKDPRKMKTFKNDMWGIHGRLQGGVERGVNITDILANPKKFNKILKMSRKEGMKRYTKSLNIEILHTGLTSLGFAPRAHYYEPWWLVIRLSGKQMTDELISKVKKAIDGYIYRELNYGGVELTLNVKGKHLAAGVAKRKEDFIKSGRKSSVNFMNHYVEVKNARRKA
jgi:hypothetical protein